MITRILNRIGLFTAKQVDDDTRALRKATEYIGYLEAALDKMPDESQPIVVLGDSVIVRDVTLSRGKQIIVSPFARFVHLSNIHTL